MEFVYNDGGRKDAGYRGYTGDCVTRAIAIATGKPYQEVYDGLLEMIRNHRVGLKDRITDRLYGLKRPRSKSPRSGVPIDIVKKYLADLGWKWIPTMRIGQGCNTHLSADELPKGRLIVRVSKHITCVIDGVIHDTFDCSRDETRFVYGLFIK